MGVSMLHLGRPLRAWRAGLRAPVLAEPRGHVVGVAGTDGRRPCGGRRRHGDALGRRRGRTRLPRLVVRVYVVMGERLSDAPRPRVGAHGGPVLERFRRSVVRSPWRCGGSLPSSNEPPAGSATCFFPSCRQPPASASRRSASPCSCMARSRRGRRRCGHPAGGTDRRDRVVRHARHHPAARADPESYLASRPRASGVGPLPAARAWCGVATGSSVVKAVRPCYADRVGDLPDKSVHPANGA